MTKSKLLHLFTNLLLLPTCLLAGPVIEQWKKVPSSKSFEYQLIDLGDTEIAPAKLSKYALPLSYAPDINNLGQVSGNRADEGFIKDLHYGELTPKITTITSYVFGINNNGDLLLSFNKTTDQVDWWIWNQKNLRKQQTSRIELVDLPGKNLFLRAINDSKIAVGSFIPTGVLRPIIWTPKDGLHHLGYYLGWDITGVAWNVNDHSTVLGYVSNDADNPPFVWSAKTGLDVLRNYHYDYEVQFKKDLNGQFHFADMVIGDDNLVYGNFWLDDPTGNPLEKHYFAYRWDPQNRSIRVLDLEGMRINAINKENTLAGSWQGHAAICDQGNKPVTLLELAGETATNGWELIDATGINDRGDIVGWGHYKGKVHIFLLKKGKQISPNL